MGKTSYDFVDPSRREIYSTNPTDKRELMVYIWYPSSTVPGATPAPYQEDAVVQALASIWTLPPDDVVQVFHSVQTRAVPKAALSTAQCSYPVLIFSPGQGGLPEQYTSLASELASHGYVVAAISHNYDAVVSMFPDGRIVPIAAKIANEWSLDQESVNRIDEEDVNIRTLDARFVLNELEHLNANDPQRLFTGHLDLNRSGILGHSVGGTTTAKAMLEDTRFKAGLDLDGNSLLYQPLLGNQAPTRPFMLINSEQFSTSGKFGPPQRSFYEKLKGNAYDLTIQGTEHANFVDSPLLVQALSAYSQNLADQLNETIGPIGSIDAKRGAQIIKDYTLAFFDKYLKNQNSPLLNGSNPNYPEVQFSSRNITSGGNEQSTFSTIVNRPGRIDGARQCRVHW